MLGSFLAGQKVRNIDNRIPAIEGSLGGHKYYSFSIEPDKLLKIGYVLHRSEANRNLMPTYQRLIKRERLRQIKQFVDGGGFFPNSLLINIDTGGRELQFDLSGLQVEGALSRIGVLHLPQKYRSAYIIDGQHRLYGYSDSHYSSTNSIPVVAFINLSREEQVRLFMEINENQKTVSKNLRNTLNADLLWDSESYSEQRQALRLHIAQSLGEDRASPLFGRVIIGESTATTSCTITIDTVQSALKACDFLSSYNSRNEIVSDGSLDKGNLEATKDIMYPLLVSYFGYFADQLSSEWLRDESTSALLVTNNGVWALIKVLNDIVNHLIKQGSISPKKDKPEAVLQEALFYLDPLLRFFEGMDEGIRSEFRRSYGSGGKTKLWRNLQKAIRQVRSESSPDGLDKYLLDSEKRFNEESYAMIRDIEMTLKDDFQRELEKRYGEHWPTKGLPKSVYDSAQKLLADKAYEAHVTADSISLWDCLTIINYRDIAVYGSHWSEIFEKKYTRPEETRISGGKSAKTEWLQKLNRIRNQNFHTYSVKHEEYLLLKELHSWLVNRTDDA